MAEMTVTDDGKAYFGAVGLSDPIAYSPGIVAYRRSVNLAESPMLTATGAHEFLALPASFVVTGVLCKETSACTTSSVTVALKSDSTSLVAAFGVGADDLAETYTAVTSLIRNDGDMVVITPAADITTGELEVTVVGYLPDGDSKDNYVLEVPYKETTQEKENVAGDDLYLRKLYLRNS